MNISQNKKLLVAPAIAALTDIVYYLSIKGSWFLIGLFFTAVMFILLNTYYLFKLPKLALLPFGAAVLLLAPITNSMLVGTYWFIYGFAP